MENTHKWIEVDDPKEMRKPMQKPVREEIGEAVGGDGQWPKAQEGEAVHGSDTPTMLPAPLLLCRCSSKTGTESRLLRMGQ